MMNITNIVVAICSLLFFMIGADKFLLFLEPPCSLMSSIPPTIWKMLGVLQLIAGVFFAVFMLVFTIIHLINDTYDIGGSGLCIHGSIIGFVGMESTLFKR